MKKIDWFPGTRDKVRAFCQNLKTNAPTVAAALNIDATTAVAAADAWLTADDNDTKAQTAAAGTSKTLQTQDKLTETALRAFVKQVKATPGVTPKQLEDLDCDGPETDPTAHKDALMPAPMLAIVGGYVEVKFVKHGHQGIILYSRRPGETAWTKLGLDTHSPYVDTRPNLVPGQAETREYYAYYCDKDKEVGEQSGVYAIPVNPPVTKDLESANSEGQKKQNGWDKIPPVQKAR